VHRLPVKLRQHWRPLALFVALLVVTTGVFGSSRVVPYVTGDDRYAPPVVTQDIAGTRDLFDASVAHEIRLTFSDEDYERILQEWYDEGEKAYLAAELVVDGVRIDSVGVRLKGNSTLMSLRDPNADPTEQRGPGAVPFRGGRPPEGAAPPPDAGGGGFRGPGGIALSAEEPEHLPWLISFDEFVEGRRYQGRSEIAVRPASASSTVALNEAVALSLVNESGQVGQQFAYARFVVNDRPATTRLVIEHPDEAWTERFGATGVLYKSRASSSFTDQGDDPTEYRDDFEQINRVGSQDLQPVINLIKWVASASDEEFTAELGEHVDIESLARYLATQNLLLNVDDMSGPGRNYYLWYDLDRRTFEVVTWDLNLAFSGNATAGPNDAIDPGGVRGPGGTGAPPQAGGVPPAGAAPGGRFPGEPRGGGPRTGAQPGGRGPMMMSHPLKERFLANARFKAAYEQAYEELYQQLYAGGAAIAALDRATAAALAVADPTHLAAIQQESDALRRLLEQRAAALAVDPLLSAAS
jgi:Spore coat assembly protein